MAPPPDWPTSWRSSDKVVGFQPPGVGMAVTPDGLEIVWLAGRTVRARDSVNVPRHHW
jgi:hypothetical protein